MLVKAPSTAASTSLSALQNFAAQAVIAIENTPPEDCYHKGRARADRTWRRETGLAGWARRTRTQKWRRKLSLWTGAQIFGNRAEFRPRSLKCDKNVCRGRSALASALLCLIRHVGWNKIPSGVSREASVRLLRSLKSGDQGHVQCDSHGTFDTRGTVRTRRSRSIKRTQGPAADRAASQQGVRRTTHAQQ
jgi:hypothetical protein